MVINTGNRNLVGLARAGGADDPDRLIVPGVERDVLQGGGLTLARKNWCGAFVAFATDNSVEALVNLPTVRFDQTVRFIELCNVNDIPASP